MPNDKRYWLEHNRRSSDRPELEKDYFFEVQDILSSAYGLEHCMTLIKQVFEKYETKKNSLRCVVKK